MRGPEIPLTANLQTQLLFTASRLSTHPPTWRRETDQQVLHLSLHTCTHEMPPPVPHLLRLAAGDITEANNPAFGQVQVP